MSTLTTTPTPSVGRKGLAIGLVAIGTVAAAVVAIPRVVPTTAHANAVTAVQHGGRGGFAIEARGRAVQLQDGRSGGLDVVEQRGISAADSSVTKEQVGGLHQTYPGATTETGPSSTAQEQIGGQHGTYPFAGAPATPYRHFRVSD
jgi:hypothetical protein